jgi:uncharacterized membrane protein (DUF2068 family)
MPALLRQELRKAGCAHNPSMETSGTDLPPAIDAAASTAGLRAVAIFEAAKGLLVLLVGLGLLELRHRDVQETAENLLLHLHIGPDRRLAHVILDAASKLTDTRVWALTATAVAYAGVRFTEAWGLWNWRSWAQWFALFSGALYLPWEVWKVVQRANWVHAGVFVGNVIILLYMAYLLVRAHRSAASDKIISSCGRSRDTSS